MRPQWQRLECYDHKTKGQVEPSEAGEARETSRLEPVGGGWPCICNTLHQTFDLKSRQETTLCDFNLPGL